MIYDHGLELPDICDFPRAGPSLFPAVEFNIEDYDDAFQLKSVENFKALHKQLLQSIQKTVLFSYSEGKILQEQTKRIYACVELYLDYIQRYKDKTILTDQHNKLKQTGAVSCYADISEIKSLLKDEIEYLQNLPDSLAEPHFYDRFIQYSRGSKGHLFNLVQNLLNNCDFLNTASRYNGTHSLQIHSVSLQVSRVTDSHHYQTLRDMPNVPALTSLHMDPKYGTMKVILYLTEVDDLSGPLTTVPGSNNWVYPTVERIVACGNSIGNYLDSPSRRYVLRAMPKPFRKNVIVGRYLLDSYDISTKIKKQLYFHTSDKGNCILFDPVRTLHRGGLCKTKERINLQILLR